MAPSRGADLGKTLSRLADHLRRRLAEEARALDQSTVLHWAVSEPVEHLRLKLNLTLPTRTLRFSLLIVLWPHAEGKLAFSPSIPEVWFNVPAGESLNAQAKDVYTRHFTTCLKDGRDQALLDATAHDNEWIDVLQINVNTAVKLPQPVDPFLAFLGGSMVGDGSSELSRVGRCLNWCEIELLANPLGVDELLQKLEHALQRADRRGIVLLGPTGCGKTAVIEGVVRRQRSKPVTRRGQYGHLWQITPSRLISGMSYLGQWQSRVLAIWKHASRYDHTLYLDDMLGMYHAGVTRDSKTSVADFIRAQAQLAPVRILTEMTPEAWAVFRERDRAFAQTFMVLPMAGWSRDDTLPLVFDMGRRLEAIHHCRFDVDVLPEVLALYDRFDRTSVLPGKALAALQRLATTHAHRRVNRSAVQAEFAGRTGLSSLILSPEKQLSRAKVTAGLSRHVVGQAEPIARLTDRILAMAARVSDRNRPIGVFLLVGPTGVGKTELAKTVAKFLFGEEGLIRIDMNELSTADAAARLVGTFGSPDGILTAAARRRPHAVLLLDEVEKAHPDVLDMLLQVIGEARLTDSRGRTVDLSGMLVLMTSNLGASHSDRSTVLNESKVSRQAVYRRAAQDFFRPEFFNRIDGLLEFESLDRDVIEQIAHRQIEQILSREGLARRMLVVDIDSSAIKHVVRRGFDDRLGARAVRRQIERDLVVPIARVIAETRDDELLHVQANVVDDQIEFRAAAIPFMDPLTAPQQEVDYPRALATAHEMMTLVRQQKPRVSISVSTDGKGVEPAVLRQLALQEQIELCIESLRRFENSIEPSSSRYPVAISTPAVRNQSFVNVPAPRTFLKGLQAASDMLAYLKEMAETRSTSEPQRALELLQKNLYRLFLIIKAVQDPVPQSLCIRAYGKPALGDAKGASESIQERMSAWGAVTLDHLLLECALSMTEPAATDQDPVDTKTMELLIHRGSQYRLPLEHPEAIAGVTEMVGGWLSVDSQRRTTYVEVWLEPLHGMTEGAKARSISPVRWMLLEDHGIDLKTNRIERHESWQQRIQSLANGGAPALEELRGMFETLLKCEVRS